MYNSKSELNLKTLLKEIVLEEYQKLYILMINCLNKKIYQNSFHLIKLNKRFQFTVCSEINRVTRHINKSQSLNVLSDSNLHFQSQRQHHTYVNESFEINNRINQVDLDEIRNEPCIQPSTEHIYESIPEEKNIRCFSFFKRFWSK